MSTQTWAERAAAVNRPLAARNAIWRKRAHEIIRPFPVAPLARRLGLDPGDTTALSVRLGIHRRWIRRYRAWGLTLRQADEWCARPGVAVCGGAVPSKLATAGRHA